MNVKQLSRLLVIILIAYWFCYLSLYLLSGPVFTFFDDMLSASIVIISVMLAISFGMFTYVDNMAKELTDLRNDVNREKYIIAHGKIDSLKREILLNAGLVLILCLLERVAKSAAGYFLVLATKNQMWLQSTIFTSIRFSFFCTSIWIIISQLRGFVVAVEYRTLIASNRK
ncbi:hypothetical protein ACFOLJ_01055 [Rugamonas sp. CCM 8940]|uniref:hypothetical protein n=1 Tax=Rugamonas sp. CCM 8940 TaxID=2765359 RepID=UPI0018F72DCB|nr:hypothetical protein [Rugamonas sp. CCM 8940]MBJ7312598.1 hypothetical protein [Rugamonas sp. CCM 8940]